MRVRTSLAWGSPHLLTAAAVGWLLCAPALLAAQDMTFGVEEADDGAAAAGGTDGDGASGDADMTFDSDMTFDNEEAAQETAEPESGSSSPSSLFGELARGGPSAQLEQDRGPRVTETIEEIYAVQQIYALRLNRLELAPNVGFTLNDPYVNHPSVGASINYWWTNVLAIGANFNWYQGLEGESDLNFFVRRSTRVAIPITEYQFGANLNFTYVPLYGKFMAFDDFIFQWDAYIVGGAGVMRTRPVAVVDPEVRQFDFGFKLAFNVGVGIRVFLTKWLALYGELRNYAFFETLENVDVAVPRVNTDGSCPSGARCDPGTWEDDSVSFENNVTAHLGITIFIPFEFDYRLPK